MHLKELWVTVSLAPLIMGGPVFAGDWVVNNPKTDLELKLNQAAKVFCSARFVSGFTPAVIQQQVVDGNILFAGGELRASVADARVDESTGIVELRSGAYRGRARYYGDQGCVLLPDFRDEAFFTPKVVRNVLRPSMVPWDDGRLEHGRAAAVDKKALRQAGDLAIGAGWSTVRRRCCTSIPTSVPMMLLPIDQFCNGVSAVTASPYRSSSNRPR